MRERIAFKMNKPAAHDTNMNTCAIKPAIPMLAIIAENIKYAADNPIAIKMLFVGNTSGFAHSKYPI